MKSKQLKSWEGEFGDDYIERNPCTQDLLRKRIVAFAQILRPIELHQPQSILEVGANIGRNIRALQHLTNAKLHALEPNHRARAVLLNDKVLPEKQVHNGSAEHLPFEDASMDMVFTCTVLIHIPSETLEQACREIYRVAKRYILVLEYFSPVSETVRYRHYDDMLFKRDYGSIFLDLFSSIDLIDYGFFWKRVTDLDNVNYWLFRKI
ncbi:MAG: pseudaminic acid biosynthesis-associated methylase [Nitrospirales bacterium]